MGSDSSKKKGAAVKKAPTPMEVKTYIMVAQTKLTLYRNKKVALIKTKRREVLNSLKENNLDVAKAKMDSIIREEDLITVFDILGPLCEILKEKVTYIMSNTQCPSDIRAPLDTLIFASYRLEVEELHKLRELIGMKYGELYINKGNSNADGLVNVNLVEKLKIKPASEAFITIRLKQLCKEENFEFEFPCEIIGGNEFAPQDQMVMGGMYPQGNQGVNPYGSQFGGNDYQAGGWNPNQQVSGNPYDMGPNQNQNPYGNPSMQQQNQNPYGNPSTQQQNQNPYGNPSMQQQNQNPYGNPSQQQSQFQAQNPYGNPSVKPNPNPSMNQNPYGNPSVKPNPNPSLNQNPYAVKPNLNDYNPGGFNDYKQQFDNSHVASSNCNPDQSMNFNPNQYDNYNPNPYQSQVKPGQSQVKPGQSQVKPGQSQYQQQPPSQQAFNAKDSNINPYIQSNLNAPQDDFPRASQMNKEGVAPYEPFNPNGNPSSIGNPSQSGKPGNNPYLDGNFQQPSQQGPQNPSAFKNQSMNLPGADDMGDDNFNPYTIPNNQPEALDNNKSVSQKKYVNKPMEGFDDVDLPCIDQKMKNESQNIDDMFPNLPK